MFSGLSTSLDDDALILPTSAQARSSGSSAVSARVSFGITFGAVKALRVLALFLAYDLLRGLHLVPGLFLVQLVCSLFLVARQKPFTTGPKLATRHWISVGRFAILSLGLNLVWFYGLTLCGPLRTVLVTEHSSAALMVGFLSLFCQSSGGNAAVSQARVRGAVLYALGTLALLLVDHDDNSPHHQAYHADHASQHQELYTFFTHMFSWTDISDHKGGVLLLSLLLLSTSAVRWYGRRVAVAVGGAKRLNAISTVYMTIMLSPWALYHFGHVQSVLSSWRSVFALVFIAAAAKLADFYVEMSAGQRSDRDRLSRVGSLVSFLVAFVMGSVWTQSVSFGSDQDAQQQAVFSAVEDHQLSPGVIFAAVLFAFATLNLTSTNRSGTRGFFVGYSSAGLPLYNLTSDSIHEAGQSVMRTLKQGLKQIVEDGNSRRIFYFLLLNLFFTFVEFAYGIWTNSLGLLSDGFHMLFDCSALVMGLYAAVLARWKPTKAFSFGYDRLEVLSGFVNGLFLAIIALNVFMEAMERLFDPPTVGTERLFAVSVSGLFVNIIGIFAFSHGSSSHGHSHGGGGGHGHSHNVNMEGVFLHILADTLGSVGVIISSLLIEYYGLYIADPICSLFIAVTIFLSVLPLLRQSAKILLLATPDETSVKVGECLRMLPQKVRGVKQVERASVWTHTSEKVHANVSVQVEETSDGQTVTDVIIRLLRECGVHSPVVQVEKESFSLHLRGLGTKFIHNHSGGTSNLLGL